MLEKVREKLKPMVSNLEEAIECKLLMELSVDLDLKEKKEMY
jgi:hypothetical protein